MSRRATPHRRDAALTQADHALVRRLLRERSGVVLDPSRDHFVEMRLGSLATEFGFESLAEVLEALRHDGADASAVEQSVLARVHALTRRFPIY